MGSARGIVRGIVGPIESALSTIWRPVKNAGSSIAHIGRDRETAKRLAKENADLRARIDALEGEARDRGQLDALYALAGRGQYRIVPARVISIGDITGYEWTAVLDVGSIDRIRKDMTVTTGDGLVGRVLSVGRSTSVVLLIIDPQSTVGARLEGSRDSGTLDGAGSDDMKLTLFATNAAIKKGERVVSYGSEGNAPFVPGVPIGVVTKVVNSPNGLSRQALVKPYVSMTALDIVGVVIEAPRTDPRDTVLPPKPSPSPTATPSPNPSPKSSPSSSSGSGSTPSPSPSPGG